MALFAKNPNEVNYAGGEKHFVDVIKNRSDNDTLIFRNPEEDFNHGTTLVVQPGEQAVFVNEGNIEQVFDSGTYTLTTSNYPFISRLRNALSGGISSFHCVVYFVRIASSREITWGTDTPVTVMDKAYADQFTGVGIETEVGARGSYRVKVSDAGVLLTNLIGGNYDLSQQESLRDFFRNQFLSHIVALLTQELTNWNGPLISAPANVLTYAQAIQGQLAPIVGEYGLDLLNFNISGMKIFDNEERRQAQELATKNREQYYGNMAAGAGEAARAQGQQQAYQTLGTNYQQAEVLRAMNATAANPGSEGGSLMGAGMGLTMGAGLGQMLPGPIGQTLQAAAGAQHASDSQAAGSTPAGKEDPVERLTKLKKLSDAGLIRAEEFESKKAEILKEL